MCKTWVTYILGHRHTSRQLKNNSGFNKPWLNERRDRRTADLSWREVSRCKVLENWAFCVVLAFNYNNRGHLFLQLWKN